MKKHKTILNIRLNESSIWTIDKTIPIKDGYYKEKLEEIVKENKDKKIHIYNDIGFVKNEIIEIPKIDKMHREKFILKEVYKRESEKLLVGARDLNEECILLTMIEKVHLNNYLSIRPKGIESVKTVVDTLLSRIDKEKDFLVLKSYESYVELVVWTQKLKDLIRIKKDENFDLNLLYLDIRNILSSKIDTMEIENIYIDFDDKSIKEILNLNDDILIESIDSIINIQSINFDEQNEINFLDLNNKHRFSIKLPDLNIVFIVILVLVSLFNLNKYFKNINKLSPNKIGELNREINTNKEILDKGMEGEKVLRLKNPSKIIESITSKVPRDVYIEGIYLEDKNQRIEGNSIKRENILLFFNNLNKDNEYELEDIFQAKDNDIFRFVIRSRSEGGDFYE